MKVSELKTEMDQRFVDVTKQIADEGEKTRRHFDVVAAEMNRSEISSWISPSEPARDSIV